MLAIAVEHVTFDGWICLDFVLLLLFVFLNDDCVWFLWGSVDAECIDLMYRFESGNWSWKLNMKTVGGKDWTSLPNNWNGWMMRQWPMPRETGSKKQKRGNESRRNIEKSPGRPGRRGRHRWEGKGLYICDREVVDVASTSDRRKILESWWPSLPSKAYNSNNQTLDGINQPKTFSFTLMASIDLKLTRIIPIASSAFSVLLINPLRLGLKLNIGLVKYRLVSTRVSLRFRRGLLPSYLHPFRLFSFHSISPTWLLFSHVLFKSDGHIQVLTFHETIDYLLKQKVETTSCFFILCGSCWGMSVID